MAALAAAAASVTPEAVEGMAQRFPEEDARKLFALLASKKGNVEEAAALYEVREVVRRRIRMMLLPGPRPNDQAVCAHIPAHKSNPR